ncbi:MAG TPA: hypothetical protein VHB47_08410 [Thermoanaerobaculia bacterium]|jgi:hypothetical protein|nr:hypothetical protein [Thermoanaerobaculia bacterium]
MANGEKFQPPPPRPAGEPAAPSRSAAPARQAATSATPETSATSATAATSASIERAAMDREIRAGFASGVKAVARDTLLERRPYLKMAFANPYNLSLLTGGLTAALLTANPFLALGALGLEALWLLHAPDSRRLRALLWDPRFDRLKRALAAKERARRMAGLSETERARVGAIVERQEEIRRLAAENPSFAADMLQEELAKTDRLVDAFVEMALTCDRYVSYLRAVDADGLDRDRKRFEKAAADAGDDAAQAGIAKRNLAIVVKRIEKLEEIRRYLKVARGQLDLIDNSFQLIADQIVTMRSPQELSGQLDELLDGVEAVRQTNREAEQFLASLDRPV